MAVPDRLTQTETAFANPTTWFRVALVTALVSISYLATTPTQYEVVVAVSDKVEHIAAFWVLGLLADFSFPRSGFGWPKIGLLLLYALAIETVQSFLPYRSSEWQDLVAGAIGMAAYGLSVPLIKKTGLAGWRWRKTNPIGAGS